MTTSSREGLNLPVPATRPRSRHATEAPIADRPLGTLGATARSAARLAERVARNPGRAMLRVLLRARLARRDLREDHARYLAWLGQEFQADAGALDAEYEDGAFRRDYLARLAGLHAAIGPQRIGTSDEWCLRALYLLVRAARPRVVVETGVLYGASSAHFLAALDVNGEGELYSIDLAHAAGEPPAGHLVPERLANRWTLVVGDSRRELPLLLQRLGRVDLFHHDSLHTFEHMTWEYQTALPYLARRGILSSHDVLWGHSLRRIFRRNAFPAFCERNALRWQIFQNNGLARTAAPTMVH